MTEATTTGAVPAEPPVPADAVLGRIEALAAALAREAGDLVAARLHEEFRVDYKADAKGRENTSDPVSEVDHAVEALLRERVLAEYPDHVILGEESDTHPAADTEFVWVVDPVDGTANFINGFPLFAVSIGVLHRGRPVVGAVWCGATHALGPGVYHAREGGPLYLDGVEVPHPPPPAEGDETPRVKRSLAAAPGGSSAGTRQWDHRVTGSMAVEAAFVAAGIFDAAPFWAPKIWDVAGGIVLVRAAGREAWTRRRGGWEPFERFEAPERLPSRVKEERAPSLRDWRGSVVVGTAAGVAAIRERSPRPPWWRRIWGSGS